MLLLLEIEMVVAHIRLIMTRSDSPAINGVMPALHLL